MLESMETLPVFSYVLETRYRRIIGSLSPAASVPNVESVTPIHGNCAFCLKVVAKNTASSLRSPSTMSIIPAIVLPEVSLHRSFVNSEIDYVNVAVGRFDFSLLPTLVSIRLDSTSTVYSSPLPSGLGTGFRMMISVPAGKKDSSGLAVTLICEHSAISRSTSRKPRT